MGTDVSDDAGVMIGKGRLERLSPSAARLALAALLLVLLASLIAPTMKPGTRSPWEGAVEGPVDRAGASLSDATKPYDEDIALYEVATERIRKGEHYYDFIVPEQRSRHYPVNPGLAVRLPTLAYINAALGEGGQMAAAIALMLAIVAAWWRRLGEEPEDRGRVQRLGTAFVFVAASLGLNRHYFPLHELWAGGLIALSFALHRPEGGGREGAWRGAFVAAALALAIRELALPYVLLMAAFAVWRRSWYEAAAWILLTLVFLAGLAWHLTIIAREVVPSDPHGPPWLVMRGMAGWLVNVVQSSNLRWLPPFLAGPAVVLMTFGWLGWRSPSGLVGFLLGAGYGLAFMIAGRWDNFYWGAMIAPTLFVGLVFAPRALRQLALRARMKPAPN
ncbi:hypothetical protein AB3M93_02840 [Novosphingobium panipatense]|uniref:hypothetical protein n=1 Tax=Novosphingobium TaxID=165696 RepID=UPI001E38E0C1|nr:hypothetical protein [Novosphingobium sp. HII-3]